MIMGDICTRACAFCNVATGRPTHLDSDEPRRVADAVARLGLEHVVVTSVDRDDLADGGARHFAETIHAIRSQSPQTTIEVLTPDFLRKDGALETVIAARPDVFNHNLETVARLQQYVRRKAQYEVSLKVLEHVKKARPEIRTKSGLMLGLGVAELLSGFAGIVRAHALKKLEPQTSLVALLTFILICATWVDAWNMDRSVTLNFGDLWAPILVATCSISAGSNVAPHDSGTG